MYVAVANLNIELSICGVQIDKYVANTTESRI